MGPRSADAHVGRRDDEFVAEPMAVRVVDGLEVIGVDDQQCAALQTAVADALYLLIKAAPVQ
jgi:hypothetical protein